MPIKQVINNIKLKINLFSNNGTYRKDRVNHNPHIIITINNL